MTPDVLEQWRAHWRAGRPVEGPEGFEANVDALAYASQVLATAVEPASPRVFEDNSVLPMVDNPVPVVLGGALDEVLACAVGGHAKEVAALSLYWHGLDPGPMRVCGLDGNFHHPDMVRWQAWSWVLVLEDGVWVNKGAKAQQIMLVAFSLYPDEQACAQILEESWPQFSASDKRTFSTLLFENLRISHAPLLDMVMASGNVPDDAMTRFASCHQALERFSELGCQRVLEGWIEVKGLLAKKTRFGSVRGSDVLCLRLALLDKSASQVLKGMKCDLSALLGAGFKASGFSSRSVFYEAIGVSNPGLVLDDMRVSRETYAIYNFLLRNPDVAASMELKGFLKAGVSGSELVLLPFVAQGRTLPLKDVVGSSVWRALVVEMEEKQAPSAQVGLCALAHLIAPREAREFLECAAPSMALTLGAAWSVLQMKALIKDEKQ